MQRSSLLFSRVLALGLALLLAACGGGGSSDGGGGTGGIGGTGGTGGTGGSGGSGGGEPEVCTQPIIDRLEPAEGYVGTQVKVFGRCFMPEPAKNRVAFNGTASSVLGVSADGTQISTSVPSGAISGPISISSDYGQGFVRTDGPSFTVTTDAPPPALSSISPSAVTAGAGELQVTLSGSGFVFRSKAYVDDEPLDTFYTSPTSLKATLPAALLAEPRSLAIKVVNPPPGGGTSETRTLEVVPALNVIAATATALNKVTVTFDRAVSFSSVRDEKDWNIQYGASSLRVYKVDRVGNTNTRVVLTTGNQNPNRTYTVVAPEDATSTQGGSIANRSANFRAWGSDPELLGSWGTAGCGNAGLHKPSGLAVLSGMLYVTEEDGQQVQLLSTADGTPAGFLGNDGTGAGLHDGDATAVGCPDTGSSEAESFAFPRGHVVADLVGARWVADTGNDRIFRFNADGSFLETVTRGINWDSPVVLGVAGEYIWIANGDDRIYPLAPTGLNGNPLFGHGQNAGQFNFDLAGGGTPGYATYFQERYISDPGNHRVQKFLDASPQGWIGKGHERFDGVAAACLQDVEGEGASDCAGTGNGEFTNPSGLAVDQSGNLWVLDDADADGDGKPGRVQKFSRDGTFLHSFNLDYLPGGIAVDADGNLWIADQTNNAVHKYGI